MKKVIFPDEEWTEEEWKGLLKHMIDSGLLTWKEASTITLGQMNPSQVGTSLASSEGFKKRYGKGNTMQIVMNWFYNQDGKCIDCGTRLELQADHDKPRERFKNPLDADYIENMVIRCRRCNVIKRPSHLFGGNTFLTAESALMWILFTFKPRTLRDYIRMCRLYGMTMADIRMQEGWAMAFWLQRAADYEYTIDDKDHPCNIVYWNDDGAITRCWIEDDITGASLLYKSVLPSHHFLFIAAESVKEKYFSIKFFRIPISFLNFSHYFIGTDNLPQSLAFSYSPPKRNSKQGDGPTFNPFPPRGMRLITHCIANPDANIMLTYIDGARKIREVNLSTKGRQKIIEVPANLLNKLDIKLSTK